MWYPFKSAFRAGNVGSTQWDDVNIGSNSVAMGSDVTAKGFSSLATGLGSTAPGNWSTAMGFYPNASGAAAVALGYAAHASGDYSTAMGYYSSTTATGSSAIGYQDTSGGLGSVAMGYQSVATGQGSVALGYQSSATGSGSAALGYRAIATGGGLAFGSTVSTDVYSGSVIIGDGIQFSSPTTSSDNNQMTMRFIGGYRLFTSINLSTGVTLSASGSSWSTVSDSTKKEHFERAEGEDFLQSVSRLRLGSWNYKGQDVEHFRHYGPMAQEIFHYFGKDRLGTIGNDTTLASADMDGIMMICLQALEKRTAELKQAQEQLQKNQGEIAELKESFKHMQETIARLDQGSREKSAKLSDSSP